MASSLYIHIPFCDKICSYCDFCKVFSDSFSHEKYLSTLIDEIRENNIPTDSLETIYIGGGTPSCLSYLELETLLSFLHSKFPSVKEFTLEANPESLDKKKIILCKKYGVNRISLGLQTTNPILLKKLNRNHTMEDVERVIHDLRELHFENVNLDFIYGLPSSTMDDLKNDLLFCQKNAFTHLSFYSLQIEEGTLFYNQKTKALDEEHLREEYDFICSFLKSIGFYRYEISNFSKPSFESKHNLTYWHDEEYYACGVSASGYVNKIRYTNTKSIQHYSSHQYSRHEEFISEKDEEFEFLMLNLRLEKGFSLSAFKQRFHKDFLLSYAKEISKVHPYIEIYKDRFYIKKDYLYTMDSILLELLKI